MNTGQWLMKLSQKMKYKSVHAYLDTVLKDIPHPTHSDIKNAKREYYSLWYKHYRREKRKLRKEYTLGFDTEILSKIHNKRDTLSVSQFLYQCVLQSLEEDTTSKIIHMELLRAIQQQLMQLINGIEEAIDNDLLNDNEILFKIEKLEQEFEMLFDTK